MTKTRRPDARAQSLRWAAFASIASVALAFALFAVQPAYAAPGDGLGAAYPRLGIWTPDLWTQSPSAVARYDFVVLNESSKVNTLHSLNPNMTVMAYINGCELKYRLDQANPINDLLKAAAPEWILTQAGTKLSAAVDSTTNTFPVLAMTSAGKPLFKVGEPVLVDRELAYVTALGTSSITVTRGLVKPSASHGAGARVAAVAQFWPGNVMMNVTASCPRVTVDSSVGPETFIEWNARMGAALAASAAWDGLFADRTDGGESWVVRAGYVRSIDPDRTNRVLTDYTAFDSSWNAGMIEYLTRLRGLVGTKVIMGNQAVMNFTALNGVVVEGFPKDSTSASTWRQTIMNPTPGSTGASYLVWSSRSASPNLSTIMTDQWDGDAPANWRTPFVADYRKMRLGLTTALMGAGCFNYALPTPAGWSGHEAVWFDEYDNAGAGKGYLGSPTGSPTEIATDVWRRDFTGGIAIVNPSAASVTVSLGGTFRKIDGTQDRTVNNGASVTAVTVAARDGVVLLREAPLEAATSPAAAPAGDFILGGGAPFVNSVTVNVTSMVTGATQMRSRVSSGAWSEWTAYAPTSEVTLPETDGDHLVEAEYRGSTGETLSCAHTIRLTLPAPSAPSAPAPDPAPVTLPPTPPASNPDPATVISPTEPAPAPATDPAPVTDPAPAIVPAAAAPQVLDPAVTPAAPAPPETQGADSTQDVTATETASAATSLGRGPGPEPTDQPTSAVPTTAPDGRSGYGWLDGWFEGWRGYGRGFHHFDGWDRASRSEE